MTREEAIKLLVNAKYSEEWQGNENLTTAHNMAIKALEQTSPCDLCRYNPPGSGDGKPCSMCPACNGGDEEW